MCACRTVCPAAVPSFRPMLNPSGWYRFCTSARTSATRLHIASWSSSERSKKQATCCRGTIRECPGEIGKESNRATAEAFSARTSVAGEQKGQVKILLETPWSPWFTGHRILLGHFDPMSGPLQTRARAEWIAEAPYFSADEMGGRNPGRTTYLPQKNNKKV